MLWIFLSVCCSIIVSVMLKLAKRYEIDVYQAVVWNYSTAILLSWLLLKPHPVNFGAMPWTTYVVLALLLPFIFIILGGSIRLSGIVRTEVAQRMSLLIPIIAAFLLFGETPSVLKFVGIVLGFTAILFTVPWKKNAGSKRLNAFTLLFLLLVFAGFGTIDVLFKQIAVLKTVTYNTSLFIVFILSFAFAFVGLVYQVATKKMKFSWLHIPIGWTLGIFNFCNILFYLKAHKALATKPSIVFAGMNIGVMAVGAIIGLVIFKEKLTLLNKIGIAIAIIAVVIMARS